MNNFIEIDKRNKIFLKEYLKMTKETFFEKMKQAGKPKGYGEDIWSVDNPTAGRCASVINALRLSGIIPAGYFACGQNDKNGSHYYLVNPNTGMVIDPTCYQMEGDYEYGKYHRNFLPQVSKNVIDTMKVLGLEIDKTKFKTKMSRNTLTVSKV